MILPSQQIRQPGKGDNEHKYTVQSTTQVTLDFPPDKFAALDSMSNIAVVPEQLVEPLCMYSTQLKHPIQYGSASNDNISTTTHVAKSTVSIYTPLFHVGPASVMAIIPTYWLSKMGYKLVILPHEQGFEITSAKGQIVYREKQHSDKFHYVSWDFIFDLKPDSDLADIFTSNPDPIDTPYINSVIAELDFLELCNSHKKTRATSPITRDIIQAIRECHSRFGHMSPRAMAATIASQSRADLPHFSADQVIKVMERWPCIFCRAASMRRNSEPKGSGVKPSTIGSIWSIDNKDGYTPCLKWGYTGYHICEDHSNQMLYIRGHKGHDAQSLLRTSIELASFVTSRGYQVERYVVDAGKVESSREFIDGVLPIAVDPVPPKSQHMNLVERSVQTIDNKTNAVLSQAVTGGTLGDSAWFSSLKIVALSLNTQVRKGSLRGITAYEDYYKVPPNLNKIFSFRIGQIVTVTKVDDIRHKTSHDLRGTVCIALHPEPNDRGTWVWLPSSHTALLRGNKDITTVEYDSIPNQSLHQYRPTQGYNKTYPDTSIIRLIEHHANLETTANSASVPTTQHVVAKASAPTLKEQHKKPSLSTSDDCPTPTKEEVSKMMAPQYWNNSHSKMDLAEIDPEVTKHKKTVTFSKDLETTLPNCRTTAKPASSSQTEFNIQQALDLDHDTWMPLAQQLLDSHQKNGFIKRVDSSTKIPADAQWFPASILCKVKIDTKRLGNIPINYVRFVAQDSTKRRKLPPHEVYSSVATAKNIKKVIALAAWHGLPLKMADIKSAFPNTTLPKHLKGKVFLKLPKALGSHCYEMITCIEGFQISNNTYDATVKEGLLKQGFGCFPGDEQMITKRMEDGHFLLAAKVVDNFIITATTVELVHDLFEAVQLSGYDITEEANDKFVGMEIIRLSTGEILVNQQRHITKLQHKHNPSNKKATTPLPSDFTLQNYLDSHLSPPVPIKLYQEALGESMWVIQTRVETTHSLSLLSQKTHHCTERDYSAIMHLIWYLNNQTNLSLIYHRAPTQQRVTDNRLILSMPIGLYANGDGANNCHGAKGPPGDQIGYGIKLFAPYNAVIRAVSKIIKVNLSSTETEVSWAVAAMRDMIDSYFLLNFVGFSNIGQFILEGDNLSAEALYTTVSPTQKRSKHFSMSCAWIRQFYDEFVLWPMHTPSELLSSDILTKRTPEVHFVQCRNDLMGIAHIQTDVTSLEHVPIRRSDHVKLWPVVQCAAIAEYDEVKE